jgi:transcriptional regulator with XRE-family HTH domain
MHLGKTIERLRKEKHITLVDLSQKSGVAIATLSRIENGKMIGRVESHIKICDVLSVTLPELYKDFPKKTLEVAKEKIGHTVGIQNNRFSSELLMSNTHNKKIIPFVIRIAKEERTSTDKTKTGVDKFIYMLQGNIEAHIGNEKYGLSQNNSMYFDSSVPHYFKNMGIVEARLICIVCPPIL